MTKKKYQTSAKQDINLPIVLTNAIWMYISYLVGVLNGILNRAESWA